MTPVGKILILPKGRYEADTVYKMLDLVMHNGTSWIAKKTVVGIEPSEENAEYWQKLVDIDDAIDHGIEEFFGSGDSPLSLTIPSLTLYNSDNSEARGTLDVDSTGALLYGGNAIFHSLNMDNYLREYLDNFLNTYMNNYLTENLETYTKAISSLAKIKTGTYVGNGEQILNFSFDFAPQMFIAKESLPIKENALNTLYLCVNGVDIVKAVSGLGWSGDFVSTYTTSIWQENIVTFVGNEVNALNKNGIEYTYFVIG